MSYSYPASTLDKPGELLSLLGSFWSRAFDDAQVASSFVFARAQAEQQLKQNFQELVDALNEKTCPVFHRQLWYELSVSKAAVEARIAVYGRAGNYGEGRQYGVPSVVDYKRLPVPADLVYVPVITNRIQEPGLVLIDGIDYTLESGELVFRENLFDNPNVRIEPVFSEGEVVDQELRIWLCQSDWDKQQLYQHFGYVLGVNYPSDDTYKQFIVLLLEALRDGLTQDLLERLIALVSGNPVSLAAEKVLKIDQDSRHKVVTTASNVYLASLSSTLAVSVGDDLRVGQQITQEVVYYDFSSGVVPAGLHSLYLPNSYLTPDFADGLTFVNQEVPVDVKTVDGKTYMSFEVGGYPTDATTLFDLMFNRAIANNEKTLAEIYDVRPAGQTTQPTAASLPATINPCQFLVENVLRFNYAAVYLRATAETARLTYLTDRILRRLVPPWQTLLVFVDIEFGYDQVSGMTQVSESLEFTDEMDPAPADAVGLADVSESVRLYYLECLCE